jgi:uncharacterized membrane protein YagU involved in acid resistance
MRTTTLFYGILGGLAGGLVFGGLMAMMGILPMIGKMAGVPSAGFGFLVHMVISGSIGAGFALVFGSSVTRTTGALIKGAAYGGIWWILGPLTLMPLFLGMGTQWNVAAASNAMPSLMGHLIYGAILGLVYSRLLRARERRLAPVAA